MELPQLICAMGLPRSGKSTWASKYAKDNGYPIVCPDAVRLALHGSAFIPDAEEMVWAMSKYMVKALFLAGHEVVVLDATNTLRKQRDNWQNKKWTTSFHPVNTPLDVCLERAKESNFPEEVIRAMFDAFQSLEDDEVFHL